MMTSPSSDEINQLVADLGGKDAAKRMSARAALVQAGSAALPALLDALGATAQQVRWEAAKSLTAIGDPGSAERLVAALADDDTDVRWVVAEALIALGGKAIAPLLEALASGNYPEAGYPGAHHVLHDLAKNPQLASRLDPVLAAFKQPEPVAAVPLAASKAL